MGGDHLWEAIGAMGEIIGAVAVVVTLLFLTVQLRQLTKSTKSASAAAYMQAYSAFNGRGSDPELARILRIAMYDPDTLTDDEAQAYFMFMCQGLACWEAVYQMHLDGSVPAPHWAVARNDIRNLMSSPGGRRWMDSMLPFYDEAFPAFAQEIRAVRDSGELYHPTDWRHASAETGAPPVS